MNIIKYLQMLTEMGLLDWVSLEKGKKFELLFEQFIITIFETNKKTKACWVLEIHDTKGGLKELIGFHDKNNGYWDICPLYHTIKTNLNKPRPQSPSDLQKRVLETLSKELFCC